MITREIVTWFDSLIANQSKLIYAMLWIFHNGWFKRHILHRIFEKDISQAKMQFYSS